MYDSFSEGKMYYGRSAMLIAGLVALAALITTLV